MNFLLPIIFRDKLFHNNNILIQLLPNFNDEHQKICYYFKRQSPQHPFILIKIIDDRSNEQITVPRSLWQCYMQNLQNTVPMGNNENGPRETLNITPAHQVEGLSLRSSQQQMLEGLKTLKNLQFKLEHKIQELTQKNENLEKKIAELAEYSNLEKCDSCQTVSPYLTDFVFMDDPNAIISWCPQCMGPDSDYEIQNGILVNKS